jgi:hypothetical protein
VDQGRQVLERQDRLSRDGSIAHGVSPAAYRRAVVEIIIARLLPHAQVRACFEGGSAATGRLDQYSDIDLVLVAALDAADFIFGEVEAALASVATITHRWRVDPPPFAGTAQRFYFMADAPAYFAVDCVVAAEASLPPLLERERHGEPRVYFDRSGKVRSVAADQSALAVRRAHRREQLRGAVPVYAMLVDKELTRGRALEAYGFYQALLRALIEVLGMEARPDRFDFGWRYVETELPPPMRELLASYAFVADADQLRRLAPELAAELMRRLHS